MEQCPKVKPQSKSCPPSHASLSMRNGLSGSFLDFDLLPALLARAERTGARAEATADWAEWLGAADFERKHIGPDDLPAGMSISDVMAADAWRFAERTGFIDPGGLTEDGRQIAALSGLEASRRQDELVSALAERVEDWLRGQGDAPILPLLQRAAHNLTDTTNHWAGNIPC